MSSRPLPWVDAPDGWVPGQPIPVGATPLNAAALNDMEADIAAAAAAAIAAAGSGLTPTGVKTANYTAARGELVRVDTTSGPVTITLPAAAPASTVGVKIVALGAGNPCTVATAGSNTINKTGGSTTLTLSLLNQGVVLAGITGIWVAQADDLSLAQLDARYPIADVKTLATVKNVKSGDATARNAMVTESAIAGKALADLEQFITWLTANSAKGFIGEVGIPSNQSQYITIDDDPYDWNRAILPFAKRAMDAGLWVTPWHAATHTSFEPNSVYIPSSDSASGPLARATPGASPWESVYIPKSNGARLGVALSSGYAGFNEGGGTQTASNARESTGFTYAPHPKTYSTTWSAGRITNGIQANLWDYGDASTYGFIGSRPNMSMVRLPIRWERIQRTLNGTLDATEMARIDAAIAAATAAGIGVILDIHNSGAYYLDDGSQGVRQVLGVGATQANFVDLWTKLSTRYKANAGVIGYGLMNEPGINGTVGWATIAQAAVTAIRANSDTKLILVSSPSGAMTEFTPKLAPFITDTANNFRYEGHYYLDFPNYGNSFATVEASARTQGGRPNKVSRAASSYAFLPPVNGRATKGDSIVKAMDAMAAASLIPAYLQASDTFDRADIAALYTSPPASCPWSNQFGTVKIVSNQAAPSAAGTMEAAVATELSDVIVSADITLSATRAGIGLTARNLGTDGLVAFMNKASGQDRILIANKSNATTIGTLAQVVDAGLNLGQTYHMELEVRGSLAIVRLDGTERLRTTLDATETAKLAGNTQHGLWCFSSSSPWDDLGSRWDNFKITAVDTAAPDIITGNRKTGTYAITSRDLGTIIEMDVASANSVVIPSDTSDNFPVGSWVDIFQLGTGQTKIQAGPGVTLRYDAAKTPTADQFANGRVRKRAANEWVVTGDLGVIPAVSGLTVWLDGNSETAADGTAVIPAERSGSGVTLTQATTGLRPLVKTNVVLGKSVYQFDAATGMYLTLSTLAALTAGEVFLVVKINSDPPPNSLRTGLWNFGTEPTWDTNFPFTDSSITDGFGSTLRKTIGNPTPTMTQWFLYNVISIAGEYTTNINGVQLFTTGTNTVGFPTAPLLGKSKGSVYLDGQIGEMLIFNSKLSTADRNAHKALLASKWGLTVA